MSYTNIQFLAYVLNTGFGTHNGNQVYPGLPDPAADIRARCALMQRAMDTARATAVADPQTLKVFMAPEFFFRGVTGAYSLDDAIGSAQPDADAVSVIAQLQAMAAKAQWRDWIFAFGSIVASAAPAAPPGTHEVYNLTLVQAGGPEQAGESGARVVLKEWKAVNDFIRRPQVAAVGIPDGMLYGDMVEYLTPAATDWFATSDALNPVNGDVQRRNDDGGGIFNALGVTFGLEICLDHLGSRMLSAQLPGSPAVQVQLVPSCGMRVQDVAIMAAPGGAVFGCDGLGFGSSARVLGPQGTTMLQGAVVPVGAADLDAAGTAVPVATLFPVGAPSTTLGVRPAPHAVDTGAAAGAIVTYGPTPLSAPGVVGNRMRTFAWTFADRTVQFVLLFDTSGMFTQLYVRMQRAGDTLNRFWYAVPANEALKVPPLTNLGTIRMSLAPGADKFAHALHCKANDGAFLFEGTVMLFSNRYEGRDPETVGLQQPDAPVMALAP